jgi:hypothetical protein
LHNGTCRVKGGVADQSTHRRMGFGTACKEETSRMKNVLIETSGGGEKNYVFGLRKTVYSQKNSCNKIIIKIVSKELFLGKGSHYNQLMAV